MQRHDHTGGRAPRGACGLILVVTVMACATVAAGPVHALARAGGESGPEALARAEDPIDLAAQRVQVWRAGGAEWVALSGRSAVIQGLESLRADDAVARILPIDQEGVPAYQVEVYAEGEARTSDPARPPRATLRATFFSRKTVQITPYEGGPTRLPSPPRDLPILARAFPSVPRARPIGLASEAAHPPDLTAVPPPPVRVRPPGSSRGPFPRSAQRKSVPLVPDVIRAQSGPDDFSGEPVMPPGTELPPVELAPLEGGSAVPNLAPGAPATDLVPLPGSDNRPAPPLRRERPAEPPSAPILPGSQRITSIYPRGGPNFEVQILPTTKDGVSIAVIRGGVQVVARSPAPRGIIDLEAESAIIWRHVDPRKKRGTVVGPNGETIDDIHAPMEIYLEGNVVVRQDGQTMAGPADQKTFRANQAFYDFRTDRLIALDAQIDLFAPGLIAPMKLNSPRIDQFRPLEYAADGKLTYGLQQIRADHTMMTASRFPNPGYKITNRSVDLTRVIDNQTDPFSGKTVGDPRDPNAPEDLTWYFDARQNFFYAGPVPVFYWPRFSGEVDDLEPPFRQIAFRTNNVFGQQLLVDFNGFKVFGIKQPPIIDTWNLDIDYLSARSKQFPALGTELGWFGRDFLNDLADPYHKQKGVAPSITRDYFGYLDLWFLRDYGRDNLGGGPAIITNNIPGGKKGYQRNSVPAFQDWRGRFNTRHMQYFTPDDEDHRYEDTRLQVEGGYLSDRNFLEEYYKRLFDVGLDQETLAYAVRQKNNWAWSVWGEANLQSWYTDTEWLPRLDYYRFGDALPGNLFTYSQHSGVDYATVHTAAEVDNPHIFAFIPYDPISNTHGLWSSGRAFSSHELDLPISLDYVRIVPYVQGQVAGWTNQLAGNPVGRVWGAAGARIDLSAWKAYPDVNSELFNVHGLNHKIDFAADYRNSFSNVRLNTLGVQDDLDDNTYEYARRYFALTNYVGGLLPNQYDPRQLIVRRAVSPISGPADIQASVETVQLGLHQRLQTKRGPDGRRRIIDYMTLDLSSTYFPYAGRDNFGKDFGQNTYNWQWFIGDRTSIISYGWFEFWNLTGSPLNNVNVSQHNNPFGLNVVTSGVSISRPPRANIFVGYTVLNTGPIATSALNTSINYWLSPKWYGTYSTMYDFGNHILLASAFSVTRIGADWLTTIGLTVDPQRQSYMAAIQVSPRISPNARLGSGIGMSQFDSRFAPTQ